MAIRTMVWTALLVAAVYEGWNAGSFTSNEWAIIFWTAACNVGRPTIEKN